MTSTAPPPDSQPATLREGLSVLGVAIRNEPRVFTAAVAGSAMFGVVTVYTAKVLAEITVRVVTPALESGQIDRLALTLSALALIGIGVLKALGVAARRLLAGIMGFRLQATFRRRVTRQYLRLPMAWHQRHSTGTLLSNAGSDVEAAWAPIAPLPMAVGTLVMLVVAVFAMLVADPVLGLVGMMMFPAVVAINFVYQRHLSPIMTRAQEQRAELAAFAHESFDGAMVVKTLGREDVETAEFAQAVRRLRDTIIASGKVRGLFDPMIEALPSLTVIAVLVVGTSRVASGATDTATVIEVAYLLSIVGFPIRAIGWVLGELPRSVVGYRRVDRVLSAQGSMPFGTATLAPGSGALGESAARVTLRGVSFRYPLGAQPLDDQPLDTGDPKEQPQQPHLLEAELLDAELLSVELLDQASEISAATTGELLATPTEQIESAGQSDVLVEVDFDIEPGQTVALVGSTGSGKSTLAHLVVRLIDPDTGTVSIDGTDVATLAQGDMARNTALVFQTAFIFDDSVRANVALDLPVDDAEVWAALRMAAAERFVQALPQGLDTRVGERGTTLSGGQRQRLALARALIRRPRLLVLDDATSAVDTRVEQAILKRLRTGDLAATVLVIAHRKATISLADEVIYLADGRVAARGTHDELLATSPGYRELVTAYEQEAPGSDDFEMAVARP